MANHLLDCVFSSADDSAPALIGRDETPRSYGDLRREAACAADVLARLGVRPGDRVAAQIEKSTAGFALYLGAVMAGAVFLPLNIAYTIKELAYFLGDAEPTVVVCDPTRAEAIAAISSAKVETLDGSGQGTLRDRIVCADSGFAAVSRAPSDLAAILYTSGTTGRSKGAMLTHGNLRSNAETLVDLWRVTDEDRLLHALPIYHTHGLFTAATTILAAGASMFFLPKFDAADLVRLMPEATMLMGVPTFYVRLLDHSGFTQEAARTMRLFISGSAPLLETTHRSFRQRTGHMILERYGMTETNMTTSNPYDGERRAGTVGFPLRDIAVRVVDSGRPVCDGEVGMIEVKGPNVFAGYWRNPEKTEAEFRADGYFVTGDLGRVDEDGYLHISGRGKDLIIAGGLNVYPKEVELAIDAVPGVRESAVIGVPHPDLGEGVTGVVVLQSEAALQEADVLAALDGALAKFKLPKRVMVVDELPRNAMGKVQKAALRDRFANLYAG